MITWAPPQKHLAEGRERRAQNRKKTQRARAGRHNTIFQSLLLWQTAFIPISVHHTARMFLLLLSPLTSQPRLRSALHKTTTNLIYHQPSTALLHARHHPPFIAVSATIRPKSPAMARKAPIYSFTSLHPLPLPDQRLLQDLSLLPLHQIIIPPYHRQCSTLLAVAST